MRRSYRMPRLGGGRRRSFRGRRRMLRRRTVRRYVTGRRM